MLIDHVQSRAVVIASDPDPPLAENADGELLAATWHLSAVGAFSDVWVELHATAAAMVHATSAATV